MQQNGRPPSAKWKGAPFLIPRRPPGKNHNSLHRLDARFHHIATPPLQISSMMTTSDRAIHKRERNQRERKWFDWRSANSTPQNTTRRRAMQNRVRFCAQNNAVDRDCLHRRSLPGRSGTPSGPTTSKLSGAEQGALLVPSVRHAGRPWQLERRKGDGRGCRTTASAAPPLVNEW